MVHTPLASCSTEQAVRHCRFHCWCADSCTFHCCKALVMFCWNRQPRGMLCCTVLCAACSMLPQRVRGTIPHVYSVVALTSHHPVYVCMHACVCERVLAPSRQRQTGLCISLLAVPGAVSCQVFSSQKSCHLCVVCMDNIADLLAASSCDCCMRSHPIHG